MAKTFFPAIVLLFFVFDWAPSQAAEASIAHRYGKAFLPRRNSRTDRHNQGSVAGGIGKGRRCRKAGRPCGTGRRHIHFGGAHRCEQTGTADHPIIISAQSIGGEEINGVGSFVISKDAAYVVIQGFKFTHAPAVKLPAGAND